MFAHRWPTIILLLMLGWALAAAQDPDSCWLSTLGGAREDFGYSIEPTSDGGFILAGITASSGAGRRDMWLVKISDQGAVQWEHTYGGGKDDMGRYAVQTEDGGYVITGMTDSYGEGGSDLWLIKTDRQGHMQWSRTVGGSGEELGSCVRQTRDGGYITVGRTQSFGEGNYDVWLIKTNADGLIEWSSTFGGGGNDYGYSVRQIPDGGYILAGYTESFGAGWADVLLIRTDARGQERWRRTYGGANHDYGGGVALTEDGGYVISGETHSYGSGLGDAWLIKTDAEGHTEWCRTYGGTGLDGIYPAVPLSDGGYILAGWTQLSGAGQTDIWLIKVDRCGSMIWDRTLGGSNLDWGLGVQPITHGDYFVLGYTNSSGSGSYDLALIRAQEVVTALPDPIPQNPPFIFALNPPCPNPFNDQTTLSFSLPTASSIRLEVFDMLGQRVTRLARGVYRTGWHQITFHAQGLSSGVYLVRLQADNRIIVHQCILLR